MSSLSLDWRRPSLGELTDVVIHCKDDAFPCHHMPHLLVEPSPRDGLHKVSSLGTCLACSLCLKRSFSPSRLPLSSISFVGSLEDRGHPDAWRQCPDVSIIIRNNFWQAVIFPVFVGGFFFGDGGHPEAWIWCPELSIIVRNNWG